MSPPQVSAKSDKARLLPSGAGTDLVCLLALGALFLAPILASPHFGLFSDYGQILGWPRRNIHIGHGFFREFRPLEDGRWTPLFHMVNFALYSVLGPWAFG